MLFKKKKNFSIKNIIFIKELTHTGGLTTTETLKILFEYQYYQFKAAGA